MNRPPSLALCLCLSDNNSNWEGRLDEVAIFERALSAAEIAQLAGIK
jgi:hypothetical protein